MEGDDRLIPILRFQRVPEDTGLVCCRLVVKPLGESEGDAGLGLSIASFEETPLPSRECLLNWIAGPRSQVDQHRFGMIEPAVALEITFLDSPGYLGPIAVEFGDDLGVDN